MQTSYQQDNKIAYEGMVNGYEKIGTGVSSEIIYFGKAVSIHPTSGLSEHPPTVKRFTASELFAGVAIADTTLERKAHPTTGEASQAPYGAHSANKELGILKRGRIWVQSDTAVDSMSKGVYVKNTDSAGTAAYIESTLVPAPTAATIATDVMSVAAIAEDDITVTVAGFAPITVTFGADTNTQAEVIEDLNDACAGVAVFTAVSTTGVLGTTVAKGAGITIAITDEAGKLEWDTPVAGTTPDLDDDTITVTIPGYAVQTVTFDEHAIDADSVVAQINKQIVGGFARNTAGTIRVSTDKVGEDQTVAVTAISAKLTWGSAVAGTGDVAIFAENARGSFRCYTASQSVSGYTELSSAEAEWVRGEVVGGKYFGLLAVSVKR